MTTKHLLGLSVVFTALFASTVVSAEEASVEADVSTSSPSGGKKAADDDSSAFLAAGKVGAIVPFNGLDPFVAGGVELGWVFAGTNRRIAGLLDVTYTAPHASGSQSDSRLASGSFDWDVRQKELVLQPTFLYRLTGKSAFVPFVGIGPRIYFLETVGKGNSGGSALQETYEKSTKLGVGLPLGAEYQLGPGGLFAEALFEWGPLDHRITGDSSLLAMNVLLGYRALL
jgi:hypothetical protein